MEAKRQDIGMDIDENKKIHKIKPIHRIRPIHQIKKISRMDQKRGSTEKYVGIARDFKLGTYICPSDRGSISDQELSDHQRRCADRLHGKYDHAGGPPDRKSSRIFKGYTGARGML